MCWAPEAEGAWATRSRPRVAKLLSLLGGILVALLIAEVALRVAGFTYFNPSMVDQDVGYALRPGAEGWWKREGLTYVKINSDGFHDREHTIAKPPDTFRIAVLGDSFVEAFQVPAEKAFWSVLERKLQECPPAGKSKVEVLSFGVSYPDLAIAVRVILSLVGLGLIVLPVLFKLAPRSKLRTTEKPATP